MSRRRDQRQEEKETLGRKGTATRYQIRQKLVSIGNDFYIKNETLVIHPMTTSYLKNNYCCGECGGLCPPHSPQKAFLRWALAIPWTGVGCHSGSLKFVRAL